MNQTGDEEAAEEAVQTDEWLLREFVQQGNQSALKQLLEKHSSLVMSVCQQVLRNRHDAEEAFQETFLKLARKANTIQNHSSLSSWLYRVAHRQALAIGRRNQRKETEAMNEEPTVSSEHSNLPEFDELNILHEELNELDEKYRGPLILCYLEGKSQKEAARELNITLASVKASVNSGREQLQKRLLRRGVAITSVFAAWQTTQATAATWATASIVQSTLTGCLAKSATASLTTGTTSISSVTVTNSVLTKGATWMAISTGKKVGIGMILAVLLIGGGGTLMTGWLGDNENLSPDESLNNNPTPIATENKSTTLDSPDFTLHDLGPEAKKYVINKTKTLGLHIHGYKYLMGQFPDTIIYGPDGKTVHSWRVELLPMIKLAKDLRDPVSRQEYNNLIKQCGYDVEKPWDSPENAAILNDIPDVFKIPSDDTDSNATAFLAITGPGTYFAKKGAFEDESFPASTLMIATSAKNIPWTKPEDLVYKSEEGPILLGGFGFGGFHALGIDGAAHFITPDRLPNFLKHFHPEGTVINGAQN